MNYVLISSHNVDVARMLARVAGGFFCVYFSYVVRKVRAELQRRECWSKVETENDTALSPHPSLIVFFFVLGSAFARLYLLLYETQNTRENTQQKTPCQLRKLCICLGVSNEGERRDLTGSVFQKQGKCCDHVETKFTGNQIDLTYQWGGLKWFQHRLSTTLLKRICLNNLESVRPRLF